MTFRKKKEPSSYKQLKPEIPDNDEDSNEDRTKRQ